MWMKILNNLSLSGVVIQKLRQSASLKNLEIVESKIGVKAIKKNGIAIHSLYDPIKEARTIVDSLNLQRDNIYLFIVLGVGLGYHVEILKNEFPNSIVLPIELDDDIALNYVSNVGGFLITNYNINDIYTILNFVDFMQVRDVKFVIFPGSYRLNTERYKSISEDIHRIVKAKFSDLLTRVNFDKLWIKNIFLNLPNLVRFGSLSENELKNDFSYLFNKPFVVLGAGYSAWLLFDVLKKYRDKFVLGVVDTALKTTLSQGIIPDIVFSLDSQLANIKDFFGVETKGLTLISDITVSPELIRSFKGNIFLSKTSHIEVIGNVVFEMTNSAISWIEELAEYKLLGLESGGSVSTNLFHLSLLLGANPSIMVGVDLGFPYLFSHLPGSPNHEYFTIHSDYFSTSDTKSCHSIFKDYIYLEGIKDEKCITHKIMETYKLWFDSASDTSNLENVFNISDGVKLKGIKNLSTEEGRSFLESLFSSKPNINNQRIVASTNKPKLNVKNLLRGVKELKSDIDDLSSSEITFNHINDMMDKYPFILNLVSKPLFGYFRGQKEFEECKPSVRDEFKYFSRILMYSLERLKEC
jgi:hypothetical protein